MPSRTNPIHESAQSATWIRMKMGREIRMARISVGMTQRQAGRAIGRSASWVSRMEAGRLPQLSITTLAKVAAAVGLKLSVAAYPTGRRPLDAAQLALLASLNERLHPTWQRRIEVPIPIQGDLRAVDQVIRTDGRSCAIEAFTRLSDLQLQVRRSRAKQRDIGADRLILLVRGSRANRQMLHELGPFLRDEFPVTTRAAMRALAAGRDPGEDCLIVL